jgi:N-acetylneuraminic acid mutarotase
MQQINKSMKYFFFLLSISSLAIMGSTLFSCSGSSSSTTTTKAGCWDKKADFGGITRSGAAGFVIDGKAYVVGGYNAADNKRLKDMYQYDPSKDTWSEKASFPGIERSQAVAFVINGKGYVGTGLDNSQGRLKDFYEYSPATNTWKKVADFADGTDKGARYGCVAFSVSNRGFVGGGFNGNAQSDLWEYNQDGNTWVQKASLSGKRINAFSFVIDNAAYVLGGSGTSGQERRVEKYDPATDQWVQKLTLDKKDENGSTIEQPLPRDLAGAFAIDGFAYVTCGSTGQSVLGDAWQYNPVTDRWVEFYGLNREAPSRDGAVAFAVNGNGYITTGRGGSSARLEDTFVFTPGCTEIVN